MGDSSANEASLTILGGPKAGQRFIVEESVDNIVIGSDPSCRFQIDLPGVSPVHARIWIDPQGVTVYETNSPRGLYVNDDRVVAQAPLRNGDVLWLGTPGDEDVVMIQCRFPQARGEMPRAVPAPQSLAEGAMGDTLAFGARPATTEPEEIEPEEAAIETDVADVEPDEDDVEPYEPEPTIAEAVQAIEEDVTVPTPPTEVFMVEDDIPVVIPEPAKFDMDFTKPDLPSNFEEEIQEVAAEPEPPPPIAPPEPPPVIAAPPPPPPPRAVSAPPPAPPAPRRAAARPAPAPTPAAAAPAEPATGGGLPAAVKWGGLAAGLVVLAVGGYAIMRMMGGSEPVKPQQPPPRPAISLAPASPAVVAEATPEPTPEPETPPPIQEEVTIVQQPPATIAATPAPTPPPSQRPAATPSPSQRPSPTPRPTQKAAATPAPALPTPAPAEPQGPQLAGVILGLLGQAESAAGARNFDAAIGHYDEVLKRDPQNGRAVEGKAAAQAASASLKRAFTPGRTSMSGKAAKAEGLGGFDTSGVTVTKVPDYSGRVEFEVSPTRVLPGDSYTVRIFLMNDGKKAFKVGSVAVNTTTNGTRAGGSVPVRAREVEPKDRIVLDERTAEWPAGVQSWTLEAVVQTDRDATFTNRLNWR